jgi:hypothetical protein
MQLVVNEIIAPVGSGPIVASWDRPFINVDGVNYPITTMTGAAAESSAPDGPSTTLPTTAPLSWVYRIGGGANIPVTQQMVARPGTRSRDNAIRSGHYRRKHSS